MKITKKKIAVLLFSALVSLTFSAYAATSVKLPTISKTDSLKHIEQLGIMDKIDNSVNETDTILKRDEFSKIIVIAAGLDDTAQTLNDHSVYSDVKVKSPYIGYINTAISKGFLSGMADGKFHPEQNVNFAQACTSIIKALGYGDNDVTGLWPQNYIQKAKSLKITDGLSFKNSDGLPRWAAALMIERMLNTNMKSSNQTLAAATGLYTDVIILGNSKTIDRLDDNQVLTDKGIYYIDPTSTNLEVGNKYRLYIDDDNKIEKVYFSLKTTNWISVKGVTGATVKYVDNMGKTSNMVLPDKVSYYYQGVKQDYSNIKNILQNESTIIFAPNDNNIGYEYAIINDPIYSKAFVSSGVKQGDTKIGDIDISNWPPVLKNGEFINPYTIVDKDVIYQVSNLFNTDKYILDVDNKVDGKITAILPNRLSPDTIQVDGKNYSLSDDMDISKLNDKTSAFNINDDVELLLGYDGKVVDILYVDNSDVANYGVVLNYGSIIENSTNVYTIKLLKTDGSTETYDVNFNPAVYSTPLKGALVSYINDGDQITTLNVIPNITSDDTNISIDGMKLGDNYVTSNVKVFNIMSNNADNTDANVALINWNSLYSGVLPAGKILAINKTGAFDDVNVILMDDAYQQRYSFGIVTNVKTITSGRSISYNYTFDVNGKSYQYLSGSNIFANASNVVKVYIPGSTNGVIQGVRAPDASASKIQAIDNTRIKLNDKIYIFSNDIVIYFKDLSGGITKKSINDIDLTKSYSDISVYLDKSAYYNGRVKVLVISE